MSCSQFGVLDGPALHVPASTHHLRTRVKTPLKGVLNTLGNVIVILYAVLERSPLVIFHFFSTSLSADKWVDKDPGDIGQPVAR